MIDIFIPVYNEGENIEALFNLLQEQVKSEYEVLIVYDSDEDNTLPVLQRIKNNYHFTINIEKNHYGKGALNAFKTGVECCMHDYWVFVMADLSDSLETIDLMLVKMQEGYDIVAGSRYMKGGKAIGGSILKRLFSWGASFGMRLLTGIPLHDITNGFKMYRKEVLAQIELESSAGFEVILELILKSFIKGYKITEVPAIWKNRTAGKSTFKMWRWLPKYLYWCFYALRHQKIS